MRSPHITDAVRVAMFALAMEMDEAGHVSVAREELALRLNRGKARITERLQAAVDAGLLVRTLEGKRGQVAEYVAALPQGSAYPDPKSGEREVGKGPDKRTESEHFGSGLQTQSSERLGPDCRPKVNTFGPDGRTSMASQGSAYPDPLGSSEVEVAADLDGVTTDDRLFDLEIAAAPQQAPKSRRRSAKFSIPDDYAPTEDLKTWAKAEAPLVDVDLQTQRFINHFLDRPNIKRPGWDRSWRNWMLQQQDWTSKQDNVRQLRPTGTGGHRPYQNPTDDSVYDEKLMPRE